MRLHRESFKKNGILSVLFLGSIAPTKKPRIVMYRTYGILVLQEQKPVILRKAFAVKQVSLKNVQSNA
jgi:hypothetical protein